VMDAEVMIAPIHVMWNGKMEKNKQRQLSQNDVAHSMTTIVCSTFYDNGSLKPTANH
jgi:hypothetical protein